MFLTTHAVLGALIGSKINNPAAAFVISLASHFLVDIIPHDPEEDIIETIPPTRKMRKKMLRTRYIAGSIDSFVLLCLMAYLFFYKRTPNTLPVFAGICGSILPDFIVTLSFYVRNKFFNWFFYQHHRLHMIFKGHIPRRISIVAQAAITVGLLTLL